MRVRYPYRHKPFRSYKKISYIDFEPNTYFYTEAVPMTYSCHVPCIYWSISLINFSKLLLLKKRWSYLFYYRPISYVIIK